MTEFQISPASRSRFTLRDSVAQSLREAIFDGSISTGTHLAEVELSASYGVSRATLREALRELQQQGLLTQDARGRVSVRRVSPDEIQYLFEVRLALERIAARRLCELPESADAVGKLRAKLERLNVGASMTEDMHADLDFHGTLVRLAGNPILYETWRSLSGPILSTMISAGPLPARENAAHARHAPIVDLIELGDADGAEAFLAQHMESAAELLLAQMRSHESESNS